ncbi:NAD(P)/FAD-dependent oxidoreductase [Streptomyces sp. NP160]|uniref:dihydrolipoyl dehydrogenase family protein n=1 Tax=Streptomyces sp. NP160 TaxID=2586637 RepID=UPI00111A777E|nr:NAD(P)/FAD-dependent oxidoreductase [Streptomyces sp. NP160]TNM69230.1 NAD(P)/FAD-dependent oxidoreductase [Streptomyces sp. NP160]
MHPSDERTTAAADVTETDVVVIGGGPVGENVAARAVRGGLSAVIVETELLGGECSYWACMPSKALIRPTQALAAARRLPGAREAVTGSVDAAAVLARRDSFTSGWDDGGQVEWAVGADITVVRGHGRLAGEKRVEVTAPDGSTTTIAARRAVVVATGSTPSLPPVDGLGSTPHWGSREATSAARVPGSLLVLGAGVVGCELAQAFARLGSRVTLVASSTLLSKNEARAGELVADAVREDGVDVRLHAKAASVGRQGEDGPVTLVLADGTELTADELLVATGRRPAVGDVGLDSVGLPTDAALAVDTTGAATGLDQGPEPWLYGAGDVTGDAPLTHMGKYVARAVGDVIAARAKGERVHDGAWGAHATTAQQRAVTQVTFTDPEVTSVGLTAAAAGEAGLRTRVVDLDIAVAGSALHADGYTGWARMVVDEDRRVVVGVTFVGPDTAELLHSATVAVVGEVPLERLWHAVPSYPTISEVWLRLLEAYGL